MHLEYSRLLFDFGLVVLIWLVQLVIYPGFEHYSREDLIPWHQNYTIRITYVVLPLMLGQLIFSGMQLFQSANFYTIGGFVLVVSTWVLTFIIFVPLHNQISSGSFDVTTLRKLVHQNWWRTAIWSLIFLWGILRKLTS